MKLNIKDLNIKKGSIRTVWAISGILLSLSAILYSLYLVLSVFTIEPHLVVFLMLFCPTLIAIALLWALYFAVKWIIAGFKNE